MHITVLHQATSDESTVDEHDVLVQRDAVSDALLRLGHDVAIVPCTLALDRLRGQLQQGRPDLVFNLVESLGGSDRLIGVVPLLLEALGVPYTGVRAAAMLPSSSKTAAKRQFVETGLPTLPWIETSLHNEQALSISWPSRWIRKPIFEHASHGMTDEAVIQCHSVEEVIEQTGRWQEQLGRPCFAEPYIEGREFNLSLLDGEALPVAEIDFIGFAPEKPRIVGYAAKWTPDAPEYGSTPRRFEFPPSDEPLLDRLHSLALKAWQAFELSGYCRVDFRVDEAGQPWILEINANPCLAPDAGFAAAVVQAGLTYVDAISRIVHAATRVSPRPLVLEC
jgi:D-alanine-D-alanine ligase